MAVKLGFGGLLNTNGARDFAGKEAAGAGGNDYYNAGRLNYWPSHRKQMKPLAGSFFKLWRVWA